MYEGRVLVGRYRLLSKLGGGGMGSVWRARDLTLNADLAVKLIAPHASSRETLTRFRREAQAAAAIRSTYVVQIIDYGIDGEEPFIAMELLVGESLGQRLTREGCLGPELTARILGHVGRALSLAHEREIVHRDLKPDNVFLVREGEEDIGKVLDFGIARANNLGESGVGVATQTGTVLGSPYYMSPEQAAGQPLDTSTDIWSFGVMACECLTGRRPFKAESLPYLFHAICLAPLPVPSSLGTVPPGFDAWFARAVAREKANRYPSIRQAADELKAICLARPSSPTLANHPASPPRFTPVVAQPDTAPRTVSSVHYDAASQSANTARKRSASVLSVFLGGIVLATLVATFAWLRSGAPIAATAGVAAEPTLAPSTPSTRVSSSPHVPEPAPAVFAAPPVAVASSPPAVSAAAWGASATPSSGVPASASPARPARTAAPARFETKPKPTENAAGI